MSIDATPLILLNATAITPFRREAGCILVLQDGRIAQMGSPEDVSLPDDAECIDLAGRYVLPGFIDVHVHGGRGYDFADDAPNSVDEICRFHASHGTTSIVAAIYTQPPRQLNRCIRRLRAYCETTGPQRILEGIHLEGPFLNPEMHGAIRPDYMWPAKEQSFLDLMNVGGPWILMMTIAPEIPGAMNVLRAAAMLEAHRTSAGKAKHRPLHLSIGHSNASYDLISEAIDNGLDGVTHIFNAMSGMHHRTPGILAGTLLRDELFVEVIADAVHVHPAMLQLLVKVKKHDKILLITDAIRAAGQPDGEYDFSGQKVIVRDGRAYLADAPDTLAGSTLTMDRALKAMIDHAGVSIEQAAQMASLNAARILAWKYRRGILAVGKEADLAILDAGLQVQMTIKAGHVVWRGDE